MLRASQPAPEKVKSVAELEEIIGRASSVLLTDFTGMNVAQFDALRSICFKNEVTFRVAKNRIAKIAFDHVGYTETGTALTGQTGFCIGFDDPILPIRLISDFAREYAKPVIRGLLLEGVLHSPEAVERLRLIPPREVLLAQVVGTIASPLSGFVFVINEILRSFAAVIDAIALQAESAPSAREGISSIGGSVENIITAIEKMTVLELVELKKALEEKFGVTAAASVAFAGPAAGAAPEAAEAEEEQVEFSVILTSGGDKKIQVIKEVRAITSLGLKEAKALVDEAPKPIKEGISKDEAMAIKAKIEEAGGQVEVK